MEEGDTEKERGGTSIFNQLPTFSHLDVTHLVWNEVGWPTQAEFKGSRRVRISQNRILRLTNDFQILRHSSSLLVCSAFQKYGEAIFPKAPGPLGSRPL